MNLFVGVSILFTATAVALKPEPVSELLLEPYLGHWYQTYGSATVIYGTEFGANCVTADYDKVANSTAVSVQNTVFPLGYKTGVTGYAVQNPSAHGEFEVHLGPGSDPAKPKPFANANYIVMELGPVVDGKYDYALVTDPSSLSLYVLVRDVVRFRSNYETAVLETLESKGFTHLLNKPRRTNQNGCHNGPGELPEDEILV
mmetsp:Transcript_104251/g.185254  ORF Transcript_104251/g.185254 Transcript_104251/m.185254 type:complete len:201 (+) Transcript_104251:66-668(+)